MARGLKKGQTNNPYGRAKGSVNRSKKAAQEAIADFIDGNADRLQGWLESIAKDSPEKAFKAFSDLLEYHVPKLSRAEVQPLDKDGKPADNKITIEFVGKD